MIVFLVAYGITTEWLQVFVPSRHAQVKDGMENILGIALGSAIYWLLLWLVHKDKGADASQAAVQE